MYAAREAGVVEWYLVFIDKRLIVEAGQVDELLEFDRNVHQVARTTIDSCVCPSAAGTV
jgi:hypothetical protein